MEKKRKKQQQQQQQQQQYRLWYVSINYLKMNMKM